MKDRSWMLALGVALTLLLCVEVRTTPRPRRPQELLSPAQQAELYRFPKALSQASREDLLLVEGLGEQRAQCILDYLAQHPQAQVADLEGLPGIGLVLRQRLETLFYGPAE